MLRNRTILAFVAALGVLLHAGTAAASVWCAMAGLTTSCCCDKNAGKNKPEPAGPQLEAPAKDCCRAAVARPSFDLSPAGPALFALPAALPWEQALPEAPVQMPLPEAPLPTSTSPPLLATVVLLH